MKEFKSEDGVAIWRCRNGYFGIAAGGYDSAEFSPKEATKIIAWLSKQLQKDLPE